MEVTEVLPLEALVDSESARGGGVVADMDGCAIGTLPEDTGNLLVVGPEGGFTAAESELFDRRGWPRLRLGPHVLRAETAAVVGAAMLVARDEDR
jgi:16S rRNA (uracil1498-N3)-methyltransferase